MTNPCPYAKCDLETPVAGEVCRKCLFEQLEKDMDHDERCARVVSLLLTGEV
jgi:hypothetical protein